MLQNCTSSRAWKRNTPHPPTTPNEINIQEVRKGKQQAEPEQTSKHAESSSLRMKQKLEPPTPEKPN